jgi:DNA-binding Lrp family transcriptional regulator
MEVVKRIKGRVKEVVQADTIYGRFDAVIVIEAPNLESINEILYKVIEKDPNIIHTETSLVLSSSA